MSIRHPTSSRDHGMARPDTTSSQHPVTTALTVGDTVRLTLLDDTPVGPDTATVVRVPETSPYVGGHVEVDTPDWDNPRDALLENVEPV